MATYAETVMIDGPYRYYRMGEASGTLADTSGNAGPAISLFNGPVYDSANPTLGADDGAVSFDGTDDYGTVFVDGSTGAGGLGLPVMSVEYWLKWITNGSGDDFVMEWGPTANSSNGFNVDQDNSTGGVEANTVSVKVNDGVNADRWTFPRPTANAWHHYVLIMDRTTASLVVYVDGVAATVTQRDFGVAALDPPDDTLYLMSRAGTALFGNGVLDELAIFDYALSSTQVAAHYAARGNTGTTGSNINAAPMVASGDLRAPAGQQGLTYAQAVRGSNPWRYYRMGEASGNALDTSGNSGPSIVFAGGATHDAANSAVADDDGAVSFDGVNDTGAVALDLSGTNIVSIEYWLKWTTNTLGDNMVMEQSADANTLNGFNIDQNNSANSDIGTETNTISFKTTSTDSARWTIPRPSQGVWHHYVWVLDRTVAASLTAYVDGVAVTVTQRDFGVATGVLANTQLNVMSRNGASLFGNGVLDELTFYSRVLAIDEVEDHYAARLNAATPDATIIAPRLDATGDLPNATIPNTSSTVTAVTLASTGEVGAGTFPLSIQAVTTPLAAIGVLRPPVLGLSTNATVTAVQGDSTGSFPIPSILVFSGNISRFGIGITGFRDPVHQTGARENVVSTGSVP